MRERRLGIEDEMLLVTGMVVSDRVLRELEPIYKPEWLDGAWSRRVAGWVWQHWHDYHVAPGQHVQDIYAQAVADGSLPEVEANLVATFLQRLSDQFANGAGALNEAYILDVAERRFGQRAVAALCDEVRDAAGRGELTEAEALLAGWRRPVRTGGDFVNPLTDAEFLRHAFEDAPEPLFRYGGPLGLLINDLMIRQGFIGVLAPTKRGKSWWLLDFGVQALKAGNNVAYFGTGDMTQEQLGVRLQIRLAGRSNRKRYCGVMTVPCLDCAANQEGRCPLPQRRGQMGLRPANGGTAGEPPLYRAPEGYAPCTWCARERRGNFHGAAWWRERPAVEPLTWREGLKIAERFAAHCKGRTMRLQSYPTGTLTMSVVRAKLAQWERRDGWVPDAVITDYADIMAADDKRLEFRHQQNAIWMAHRALSMEHKALVITATQSDAASYTAHTLGLQNFTEDRRKYDHVTGMLTLNQIAEEKRLGIMRVGVLLAREDDFDGAATVNVLAAPALGRPVLGSYW